MTTPDKGSGTLDQHLLGAGTHPLQRLLLPAWPVGLSDGDDPTGAGDTCVECLPGPGPAEWLQLGDWRLFARPGGSPTTTGEPIATFERQDGSTLVARIDSSTGRVTVPFSLAEAYASYVSEAWREAGANRRLSAGQLRAYYALKKLIPRGLQLAARRALIRAQGVPDFPGWPSDLSVSRLLRFYAGCALRATGRDEGPFTWFWPGGHHSAIVLTHDVEGDEGIRLALELADLEQAHGFRSSFNFGAWYEIDPGVLRELRSRGFEIGMHGLTHDRSLFATRDGFEERLPALTELAGRLEAVGFRSPATHRVFEWLAELPVDYDCTIPNSDPYEPQPGGCCSAWPFFIGNVVELPYTLPQDHTLLTLLGHRSPKLWLEQATTVAESYGLIQCVSHPDPGYLGDADKRAVYAEFLQGMAERQNVWRALPREVASWWRERETTAPDTERNRLGAARLVDGDAVLGPPT